MTETNTPGSDKRQIKNPFFYGLLWCATLTGGLFALVALLVN